ncbi:hypothetical protein EVAR_26057_1 [Eumeta japonica]|uniref:Reverse transcriptase domain-containing protein n=1 Tax=Eumeta variegata TaxID=151549 RepID=A0A4C1VPB4_EUMVA|nr:hypothetical protein EVAR_26057_1 [Eumeta japonica]
MLGLEITPRHTSKLFVDYLINRCQRVRIGDWLISELRVNYGVPQANVHDPTFFMEYINEFYRLKLNQSRVFSFADDTALVFTGNMWDEMYAHAQVGFNKVRHCYLLSTAYVHSGHIHRGAGDSHRLLHVISRHCLLASATFARLMPNNDLSHLHYTKSEAFYKFKIVASPGMCWRGTSTLRAAPVLRQPQVLVLLMVIESISHRPHFLAPTRLRVSEAHFVTAGYRRRGTLSCLITTGSPTRRASAKSVHLYSCYRVCKRRQTSISRKGK